MGKSKDLKEPCKYAIDFARVIDTLIKYNMKEFEKIIFSKKRKSEVDMSIFDLLNLRVNFFMNPRGMCALIKSDPDYKGLNCEECYVTKEYLELSQKYREMHRV